MFLESSRYYKQNIVDTITKDGRYVNVLKLRFLPVTAGKQKTVEGNDRLDIISLRQYSDSTKFWHIADANTELDSSDLLKEIGRKIKVPEK